MRKHIVLLVLVLLAPVAIASNAPVAATPACENFVLTGSGAYQIEVTGLRSTISYSTGAPATIMDRIGGPWSGSEQWISTAPAGMLDPAAEQRERKSNSNSKPSKENPVSCNPVVISTGEKLFSELDFSSFGVYGLSHGRYYRSAPAAAMGTGLFGANWNSSLKLPQPARNGCYWTAEGCVPTSIDIFEPDGSSIRYLLLGGAAEGYRYMAALTCPR